MGCFRGAFFLSGDEVNGYVDKLLRIGEDAWFGGKVGP